MSKASGVERAGGDCLEDFDQLREDAGLSELLGHGVPSAEAARKFFYQFMTGKRSSKRSRRWPNGSVISGKRTQPYKVWRR
jgi:hypothetical protein